MRLKKIKLRNFRCYKDETDICLDDLTVFIGKNDSGKSSIFDALEIFFNEPKNCPDKDDLNVYADDEIISITCIFEDLPEQIIIDATYPTTLQNEYMLNSEGYLEIQKFFSIGTRITNKVYAVAIHPTAQNYEDLLAINQTNLRRRAVDLNVDLSITDQRVNTQIRKAIWESSDDLRLEQVEIDLSKETAKAIWDKIKPQLPVFALFKSDRTSTDQDDEAQDPMKAAVKEAIALQEETLNRIAEQVTNQVQDIADRTVDKIKEMNQELAGQLNPRVITKKWESVFNVSLTGDEDIPINKRGSGTRRLILLNFFRAKAEQESVNKNAGIIYAIEEPETCQHPNNQKLLIDAFENLVEDGSCQIMLTTHTPVLARRFNKDSLRLIKRNTGGVEVLPGDNVEALNSIVDSLGVLPDHDIKIFVGVEGKNDINFLRIISKILNNADEKIPDLEKAEKEGKVVFVPSGSNVELWIAKFKDLNIPEFYIFDRDNPSGMEPHYKDKAERINALPNSEAVHTSKRELENYIHPSILISEIRNYAGPENVGRDHDFIDIPALVSQANNINTRKAKRWINTYLVEKMSPELLTEVDGDNDIRNWLGNISDKLKN